MQIVAKFTSVCPVCRTRIEVGAKVEWSKGEKARHVACAGKPATASPQRAPRNTRNTYYERRGYGGPLPGGRWQVGAPEYYSSGQYDDES